MNKNFSKFGLNIIVGLLPAIILISCISGNKSTNGINNKTKIMELEIMKTYDFSKESDLKLLIDNNSAKHTGAKVVNDNLEIYPVKVPGMRDGWFSDGESSLFYTEVSGNFMIETEATVFRLDGTDALPKGEFTSAGLIVKKPNAKLGEASWIMYNIGFQRGLWARELKVTHPSVNPKMILPDWETLSLSTLKLIPAENELKFAKLRIAKIGTETRAYYQDRNGNWVQESPKNVTETSGFGTDVPIEGFNENELNPKNYGLENIVHAGIITNPGTRITESDGGGRFKGLTIYKINSFDDALKQK
ncbi:MAG: hypothetical protein N4A49_00970 [Marinifilaceae bacterium]|jgi:hypothetical protein|nr:hypothetical protein [Marinifilaceae bacterium]